MRARLCEGRGRTFESCQVHQMRRMRAEGRQKGEGERMREEGMKNDRNAQLFILHPSDFILAFTGVAQLGGGASFRN